MHQNQLRALRQARGLSQEALAKRIGCSHALISRLERGERELSGPRVRQLCDALGCSPSELLGVAPDTDDARRYLIGLIALMSDDKIDAMLSLAHALLPHLPYRGPERRGKKIAG